MNREKQLWEALEIDALDLPQVQLMSMLADFTHFFTMDNSDLAWTSLVTHRIQTGDSPPIQQPPWRVPFALHGQVCKLVDIMLEQGVITPSSSPWASPIVLVAKKDGCT